MFQLFKNALDISDRLYILVKGPIDERMKKATTVINTLLI